MSERTWASGHRGPLPLADGQDDAVVLNLTPDRIVIYHHDAPDQVEPDGLYAEAVLFPIGPVARLDAEYRPAGPLLLADGLVNGATDVPLRTVRYASRVSGLPEPRDGVWCLVSLPVALACPDRTDLLVVDREVHNPAGTVIGCRGLAAVVR